MNHTRRERVQVVIYTLSCRIIGDLHIIPESRLTDMLNVKAKDFFALTDVKVMDLKEDIVLQETEFAAVNRDTVVLVAPVEKLEGNQTNGSF